MRVLWIKYGELLPPDTGGKLRSYNLLRHLGKEVDLTLLSYVPSATRPEYDSELPVAIPGARVERLSGMGGLSLSALWGSATRRLPLTVSRFTSRTLRNLVSQEVAAGKYDVVLCDFLAPTDCLPIGLPVPTVLFEHNVEAALWRRRAATVSGVKGAVYRWEHRALERYEREMLRRFDLTFCVSEADREQLMAMVPGSRVEVLETGVDVAAFAPRAGVKRNERLVNFVGSMDWQPNLDGVNWFLDEIWPRVLSAVPDAHFRIVGRRPPASVLARQSSSVSVAGDVASVIPHFHEAAVTVVPLRSGGGTRLKIYEAMAAGTPIVSTTVGAEGLPVVEGHDLLLADSVEEQIAAIVGLLKEPAKAGAMAANALATVAGRDWSVVAKNLAEHLRQLT